MLHSLSKLSLLRSPHKANLEHPIGQQKKPSEFIEDELTGRANGGQTESKAINADAMPGVRRAKIFNITDEAAFGIFDGIT